jgi:hypothetical protein
MARVQNSVAFIIPAHGRESQKCGDWSNSNLLSLRMRWYIAVAMACRANVCVTKRRSATGQLPESPFLISIALRQF